MRPTTISRMLTGPRRGLWAALLVLLLAVACGTFAAPHEWSKRRGPVVPHDTFPADCRLCHEGDGWHTLRDDFSFDHLAETGVPLDGAHAQAACLRCHNDRGPVAVFAARGCAGCHVDPHLAKLGSGCTDCHGESSWIPREQIARHARTRMPLVGAHAAAQCFQCHPGAQVGNFEGLDPDCTSCHTADLARATMPDHQAQGWTSDCQRCHVPLGWRPARFAHPTGFPLIAGHAGRDCAECHGDTGSFTGLSTDCASCHLDDWQMTTEPPHAAVGIGTDCMRCHSIVSWGDGRFDHPATFPLTGGHAGRDCSDCHGGGVFVGTPTACIACHQDDYLGADDPDHQAFGFPTDCTLCHNTNTWDGATFVHTFPIQGGPHGGLSCNDCHTTPGSAAFSCIDCHEHSRSEMDDEHDDVPGYVYASANCLQCHPTGHD